MTDTDNFAPDPVAQVTTVRSMCRHSISPSIPATGMFEQSVADMIIFAATFLENDGGSHFLGFVFNEGTETPFAVINDYSGEIKVVWEFKEDTNFDDGNLHFGKSATSREWAAITASALMRRMGLPGDLADLLDSLRESGAIVMGFDENGPFKL